MVAHLSDTRHFRRDLRDIKRILQLGGTIPEEKIEKLLRMAADLAEKRGEKGDTRGFKRAMDVIFKAAQIEQREKEVAPQQVGDSNIIDIDLGTLGLTDEVLAALDAARDQLNLAAPVPPVE